MPSQIALLDLGNAITDVFAFLAPADQHKLRRTSSAMCEWFDSAAENGSLAFFVTFVSVSSHGPLRWKHATCIPRYTGSIQEANRTIPPVTVTVHARNYYLSFNKKARGETDDAIIDKAAIVLVADFPFEHKLVVTGLFGMRSIGDDFCKGVKAVEVEFKGAGCQLESVGKGWMFDCPKLRSVKFAGFSSLEEVGSHWLYGCSSMESITYADGMPMLKKVGNWWMYDCEKLKHVDLTGFTALEEVADFWLSRCLSLESITFASDMPKPKKVGDCWMSDCSSLKQVDLPGFPTLEEVGAIWLSGCLSLESITFAGDMPKLRKVGHGWTMQSDLWTPQSDRSLSDHLLHHSKQRRR